VIKRLIDLLVACSGLVVLLPLLFSLAFFVRLKLGGPVIFRQCRPGKDGASFILYKFRSMRDAVDSSGRLLPDEQRLTPLGQILRSTSLDELPELVNVMRGDMSLVGPRPLLEEYLPLYSKRQARRHDVRPGITGWAQVNGRNALGWDERLEMDVWYVENQSFLLDLKIMWLTVRTVLRRDGISESGKATMTKFRGSDK